MEPDAESLQSVCGELLSLGAPAEIEAETATVAERFWRLRERLEERVATLGVAQAEHQTYHDDLHDCERWILETSFKLMSQNAAPCSSLESTQEQLENHLATMHEIANKQRQVRNIIVIFNITPFSLPD